MTVIAMSRTEIDRMSVLQDLAANRIKVTEAATLMNLDRRQVFRLAKAYAQRGPEALVSRRRGRPSNRACPGDLRDMATGIIRSPAAVSQNWEYFGMWPETFGNFAPPLANSGGWRPFAEFEKPAVGGHFCDY